MKDLFNNRGEGYINTGVKIIIAVVIGALILGVLYLLFAGDNGVFGQMNDNIEGLMEYEGNDIVVRIENDSTYVTDLQYSTDGIRWKKANVPSFNNDAIIEMLVSHEETHCAVVRDNEGVYIISSIDNGANWEKRRSWSRSYSASISWNASYNRFSGRYENDDMMQPIYSTDSVTWKNNGTPWDKL